MEHLSDRKPEAIAQSTGEEGESDPLLTALKKNYPCENETEFAFSVYQKLVKQNNPYGQLGPVIAEIQKFVEKD